MPEFAAREGGCQCGALRYRLIAPPLELYACHCRDCQKQSSSAFGMSLIVAPAALEWLRGEPKIWSVRADSGALKRCAFCADCGSRVYHAAEDAEDSADSAAPISIKAGTLDDTSWLRPSAHLWTSRAQPWVHLDAARFDLHGQEPDDDSRA